MYAYIYHYYFNSNQQYALNSLILYSVLYIHQCQNSHSECFESCPLNLSVQCLPSDTPNVFSSLFINLQIRKFSFYISNTYNPEIVIIHISSHTHKLILKSTTYSFSGSTPNPQRYLWNRAKLSGSGHTGQSDLIRELHGDKKSSPFPPRAHYFVPSTAATAVMLIILSPLPR